MQWWWNEVDALGVYDRLSGAANLASTLAPTRLGLNWTIWNNCSDPKPQSAHGGWTVGMDASGAAKQILFWVYNRNHTWSGMHNGAVLQPITGCATLLRGLPTPATGVTVNITWVNTTTGTPITPDVSRQSNGGIRVYVNGARLAEPPRTVDARHTLAYGNAVSEESVQVPALVGAIDVEIVAPTFLTDVAAVVDLIPTAFDRSS